MPLDGHKSNPYQGKNFAPLKPLQDAKNTVKNPRDNGSSICAMIREVEQEIHLYRDDLARKEILEMGRNIALLDAGKLIMKRDSSGHGYVFLRPLPQSSLRDRSNFPVFAQACETLKAKWSKIRPMPQSRHFGDGYKAEIQADAINTFVKSKFRDIFTPYNELQEALEALRFGTYIWQFWYDHDLNRMEELAPIIQSSPKVLVEGYQGCHNCAFEGTPADFKKTGAEYPQCPECGSFKTTKGVEEQVVDEMQVVDFEMIGQGDISGGIRPFTASIYDPRVLPQHSDFFGYDEYLPLRRCRQIFGEDVDLTGEAADDLGLQIMESLASHGGSIEGHGASTYAGEPGGTNDRAVIGSRWLKPEWYAHWRLSKPEMTLSGEIPANVPFGEIFPKGLCYRGALNRGLITHLYGERARVVGSVYFLMSYSGHGKGLNDSVDVAKDLNELHSMAMAGIKRYGAGGLGYDKDLASQEEIRNIFKPGKAVPFDLSNIPDRDIRRGIFQLQTQPFNPALGQYAVQLSNLLHMTSFTGDFSEGAVQQTDIDTYGGQQLAHAKEEEKKGGIIAMKVYHRMESAKEIADLGREHIKMPVFYANTDDRHGRTKGKWVSGAMLPKRMEFDSVPDSEIPQNKFEKQAAMKEAVEKAGGLLGVAQAAALDPKNTAWYFEQCGVKIPSLDQEGVVIACLKRLDEIKQLAQVYSSPEEVLSVLTSPPVEEEAGHMFKADFLAEVLDDDEVDTWPPLAKHSVRALIQLHRDLNEAGNLRSAMRAQRAQMALAAEAAQGQAMIQQPLIDQQQKAAMEQQGMEMLGGLIENEAEETKAEMAHERELEKSEIDRRAQRVDDSVAHHRAKEDAGVAHDRTKELEQIKAAAAKKRDAKSAKAKGK